MRTRQRRAPVRYIPPAVPQAQLIIDALRVELSERVVQLVSVAEAPADQDGLFFDLDRICVTFNDELLRTVWSYLT